MDTIDPRLRSFFDSLFNTALSGHGTAPLSQRTRGSGDALPQ
jgi:hypothetical protein